MADTPAHPDNDGSGYMLYHSIGQYPGKSGDMARALSAFAECWGAPNDEQWGYALGQRQRFIDLWSQLLKAPSASLTTTENVTTALAAMIMALPRDELEGRVVLVAGDCFPSLHFLLTGMEERYGFKLRTVPLREGASWVEDEDVIAAWGPEVGLALLTWVSSTSSHRCDLARLMAHGRSQGSVIGVDITQAAGLMDYDCLGVGADFAVSTSLKWMCGSPGGGILQVMPDVIARCQPSLRGWFSQDNIFSWDINAFSYAPDIRRFDNGTPSVMACAASVLALEWHAQQDWSAQLARNRALCEVIIAAADEAGFELASPRDPAERGGSVMMRLPEGIDPQAVLADLRGRSVFADARGSLLRCSPGFMTTAAGVERLTDALVAAGRGGA
ncbi:MAG: aminotransferase class V-fold PLP-dependent enzyme [Hoeflea sp.]|uniref:aminotransferase class V-fold PLP-dependent enzyme n=1 Tax=Hoeflea sp. TaxID=1940281 RepID=UPI001D2C559E|nr:aminotransferase class V-fold PLP-dependent enzyme [Hoeflea sp.]MBU4528730.1 aminotransferase class V-fold PLP-dependent enzyme [Alphaproteobacteria bacterium]MBU4545943.1 aminotransferase class V-fold PLP-dependent enzyme [Alphaproteobacteria bacterium]MBU4549864.1 aminotransferase class V-fold PLP-dependent enzyme [Alphaproteobacteria bacterium]MBV1725861.1 aminotransferase class V-fold PLP-dependent enzyme [Hoeflea sp.]MBV1762586.1 aminotransferase class V-fold PLP-dependent enzyme [Hoef